MSIFDRLKQIAGIGKTDTEQDAVDRPIPAPVVDPATGITDITEAVRNLEARRARDGVDRSKPGYSVDSHFGTADMTAGIRNLEARRAHNVGHMLSSFDEKSRRGDPDERRLASQPQPMRWADPGDEVRVRVDMHGRTYSDPRPEVSRGDPRDGAVSLARAPRSKDLKAVTEDLQARFGKAADDDVMRALGRADGKETDVAPPAPGAKRDRWIAERVAIAFDPERDVMTHSAHSQRGNLQMHVGVEHAVAQTLRHEFQPGKNIHAMAMGRRSSLSANITDFMQDGPRLEDRIVSEREHLMTRPVSNIERRFEMSPIASMEAIPDAPARKREWIEDALRAEHAAARAGLMNGPAIFVAANAERGQMPYDPQARMPRIDESRMRRQEAETAKEASQIDRLPDQALRTRFRDVPGVDKAPIPVTGSADRRTWIEVAIQARNIREAMPKEDPTVRVFEGIRKDASKSASEMKFTLPDLTQGPKKGAPPPAMIAGMARQNGM